MSEIKDIMVSLRSRIDALEAKVDELQQLVDQEDTDMDPIDLDIDDMTVEPVVEPVSEPETAEVVEEHEPVEVEADDLPVFDGPEHVAVPDDDLPFGDVQETADEPETEDMPETVEKQESEPKVAVIDSMTDRQAWRTDMPGTHVRDIRSAISLNDRILFINTLFGQDPMAFQESLTKINQMTSLDEVVSYVAAERPEWDLESETVYRFMMAVRRKVEE